MKTRLPLLFSILVLSAMLLHWPQSAAAQNTLFTYQGLVKDKGTNFTGMGQFKFALVGATNVVSYWSNDGTSVNSSEPAAAISVEVTNGLFMVVLGDTNLTNMTAIPAGLLISQPNLRLQIWFNDGVNGSAALIPAQTLTPAPYAVAALYAASASNLLGTLPTNNLPASVALLGANQTFSGTNTFSGNVLLNGGANYAAGGPENLRIVRGFVSFNGNILSGTGFTVVSNSVGNWTINFTTPFSSSPAININAAVDNAVWYSLHPGDFSLQISTPGGTLVNQAFTFIAIGSQ
jgi:hypothetical protein